LIVPLGRRATSAGRRAFCRHNNRTALEWYQSASQRMTALNGLQMTREVNAVYLETLKLLRAANRLGPLSDSPKANCGICHQGVSKSLYDQSKLKDVPELGGKAAS
jgi:photosynthetic reaction center cytochrome c subunit